MILASELGKLVSPLFDLFARILAGCYTLIPNYAIAIALLTLIVMVVLFPINRRGTRSMMKMQLLAPELKKIQAKHKAQPGASVAERQEQRQRLNEEMMALYKENNVSPTGGCLPLFLQFPVFWILYSTIRGIINTKTVHGKLVAEPRYLNHDSRMYHDIVAHPGHLNVWGLNLADSVRSGGLSWGSKAPYIVMILVAIALQYIQMRQLNGRNPAAAAANPQMQQMQKIFPIIFAVIYISIPASVNVYFIISSLFRIGQQEFMYRRDPHIKESMEKLRVRSSSGGGKVVDTRARPASGERPKGLLGRLAMPLQAVTEGATNGTGSTSPPPSPKPETARSAPKRANAAASTGQPRRQPQRSRSKRPRRPR